LWAGTWAAAAEESGAPANGANTEKPDAIEAARRELRQLQVGSEALNSNQTRLPRVAAPEWHGGSTLAIPVVTPRPQPALDARNPNWLVDAMRKPGDPSAPDRGRDGRKADLESGTQSGSAPGRERIDEREETAGEFRETTDRGSTSVRPAAASAAMNPLASFLDNWMSPQDYALLQPGFASGRSSQVGLPNPAEGFGPTLIDRPGFSGLSGNASQVAGLSGTGGPGAPRENPFLPALEPSSANLPSSLPPTRPVVSLPGPAPLPPQAAAPISPPPPPRVPEFARPASDEKHFKPLKRF